MDGRSRCLYIVLDINDEVEKKMSKQMTSDEIQEENDYYNLSREEYNLKHGLAEIMVIDGVEYYCEN